MSAPEETTVEIVAVNVGPQCPHEKAKIDTTEDVGLDFSRLRLNFICIACGYRFSGVIRIRY